MKKALTIENKKKFDKLVSALEGVPNTIPNKMKTVFNFKGRKSINIAEKSILALTEKSDTIYDPFMGAGSFVIASVLAGRYIISTELDNYTYSAVYSLFKKIDLKKLTELLKYIENDTKNEIMSLYETECCGIKNYISKVLFDPQYGIDGYYHPTKNREIKDGKNVKFLSACPICGNKSKKFDDTDKLKLSNIQKLDISRFPTDKYIANSRINITPKTGADKYDRIFTHRNKRALILLQDSISKLEDCPERDILEHSLVSALSLSRIAMYGSSTDILYHVVPYGAQDMNVWELFQSKVKHFTDFKQKFKYMIEDNPEQNSKYTLINKSYQKYCESLDNKKTFDLIYTDFPYTDQVPYLERNQLYRIWLDNFYSKNNEYKLSEKMLQDEIVESDAQSRPNKDIDNYYHDLDNMFLNFNKILKENKLLVLTMKLGKNKYFTTLIEIINLARKNGFEYALRIGIDKNDPSIRKQSAYNNTLSNEMIVIFQKLEKKERYWYIGNKNYEHETVKLVYGYITKSPNDIFLTNAVQKVKDHLLKKESYVTTNSDLDKVKNIIKSNFIIESNSLVRIDCNKLYLDIENKSDLFSKFYDYIPVIIKNLFKEKKNFVLDDLYFEIANTLCTGDPSTINQFLEDSSHQKDIERLLNSYCKTNGKVYEKKEYHTSVSKESIDISTLEGYEFEKLIKDLLEAEHYEDVISTGGAGDLGVDLLAKKFDSLENRNKVYLFQCKRWAANVGSEPMQRLVSEKSRRNADYAICVTTSNYTTDGLKISREQDIEAVDGEEILKRLNIYFKDKYYNSII